MWAIRRASVRIKSQSLSSIAFWACSGKLDTTCFSYTDHVRLGGPAPSMSDGSLLIWRFSSHTGNHSFSSQAGSQSEKEVIKEADMSGSESESEDELNPLDSEEVVAESNGGERKGSSELFKVVVDSSTMSAKNAFDKWVEEGHELSRSEISHAMFEFRRRKMYGKALQMSEWLETQKTVEFSERDYASRVDLIAKVRGMQKAEAYIDKIPESFKGEIVYRTLLANYVLNNDTKKAEKVFNKMKDLNLPITSFACNQLLLLYKRTDKKKIADVLLLMEKEDVKPSLFTYRLLIETKGMSNDIIGMEQVLETLKAEGLEPDLRLQAVLARQYVYAGMKEKAKEVLKQMEGSNLSENRGAFSSLLQIYASLGSVDDVKRVWEACENHPRLEECMNAIEAFGKLKKVEEAEAVFDQMSKKWNRLSAKHYTSMLKVYANNKMLVKGKEIVKQMSESGCRLGPLTWDALVKLYIESGEIEKADSVLNKASQQLNMKPLFATYMTILDQYAKKGDVHNAEKIFYKMRQVGYVSRYRQYDALLQAYINAKVPLYGFRERLKADNVFPGKVLAERLAQVDAFKKTVVSDLLD
ncbi:pentatricopeptide repeat-containing protein At1g80270, mitochondrial-like [Bidens hawaiensis]|uniref:pentatricopeptide repeat-containing protein At1g80270, mitochondrial-like n=1 Tax=Bidens hawaiensis TaxID=980011 RepID=UPI004049B5E4